MGSKLTSSNGLNADALLDVGIAGIIAVPGVLQNLLAAESVHEGGAS